MTTVHGLDQAKAEAFLERALGDVGGTATVLVASLADRAGLFKDLAANGPATSSELARRTGTVERYVTEAMRQLASAGYVERLPDGRYSLPAEHVPVLADEAGPMFMGGVMQMMPGAAAALGDVLTAFREGGGAAQEAYGPDWWDGMERFTASWFEHALLEEWIPRMPHVEARLRQGALVADVGCGAGRALIKLAQAFPESRYVGYELFEGQIERARAKAEAAGVGDRVTFEARDVVEGLPVAYDVITTFDVVHDAADPLGLLRAIRKGTADDGSYVMLEIACADRHEDNAGPLATLFYGFSVTYCMTTSLAAGGAGLGTCGMPPAKVRELGGQAGFGQVEQVPLDDPFNTLFELRP